MSANLPPISSNSNPINNENSDPRFSGEENSVFKDIPAELLSHIFKDVPFHEINQYNVGPKGVSRRWNAVAGDSFYKRSRISPRKRNTTLKMPSTPKSNGPKKDGISKNPRRLF